MSDLYRSNRRKDGFFREFFSEIPTFIKVVWLLGAVVSASVAAFVLYLLYTLVMHFTG